MECRDEMIDPYDHSHVGAINSVFVLIDDNSQPHRAVVVKVYLQAPGLERLKKPGT